MRFEHFVNPKTGTIYVRVNKIIARRAFNNGTCVVLTPVKVNPLFMNGTLLHFCSKDFNDDYNPAGQFERVCNSCIYYNCNNELGKYLKYYLPKNLAIKYGYKL